MDANRKKALEAALGQIERQFGKGTAMRMGDDEKKPKKGYVWAYATTQYNPVQAVRHGF